MEWLLLIMTAGGAGATARWWRARRATRRRQADELEAVRLLAQEDVTHLGERLQRLDRELGGRVVDDETRVARSTALDCYERACRAVARVEDAEEVGAVTGAVAGGRFALARAQALVEGRPVPEQEVVCFFDPRHGPSVTEVLWTRPGHGPRRVPACSQDAARVTDGSPPEVRMVRIGSRTMPYWAAGSAFFPYTRGYFAGVVTLSWAFQPGAVETIPHKPGYFGTGIGGSSGSFDGGGFDDGGGY